MGLEDPTALENLRMDKAFVVEPELRPKRKHDDYLASGNHVPVIDLSPLRDLDEKMSTQVNTNLIEQVGKRARSGVSSKSSTMASPSASWTN